MLKNSLLIMLFCGAAFAKDTQTDNVLNAYHLTGSVSVGLLQGESHEFVYDTDTGMKVSQLDWKTNHIPIANVSISLQPNPKFSLHARALLSLASGSGYMDDYDWQVAGQSNWSEHSWHPQTRINQANELDINMRYRIYQKMNYSSALVLGYQYSYFSWSADGGRYCYQNGKNCGAYDDSQKIISYRQMLTAPYLGMTSQLSFHKVDINVLFKFSHNVQANDYDEHHLKNLIFEDTASNALYYGINVSAGFYIRDNLKLFIEASYNRYFEVKGKTIQTNTISQSKTQYLGDAAGIANTNYNGLTGVEYYF